MSQPKRQNAPTGDTCVTHSSSFTLSSLKRHSCDNEGDCFNKINGSMMDEINKSQKNLKLLSEKINMNNSHAYCLAQTRDSKSSTYYSEIFMKTEKTLLDAECFGLMLEIRSLQESHISKLLRENKELKEKNLSLKSKLKDIENQRYERTVNLVSHIEERKKWKFMCSLTRCDSSTINSDADLECSIKSQIFSYKDNQYGRINTNINEWFITSTMALCNNQALEALKILNYYRSRCSNDSDLSKCILSNLYMITALWLSKLSHQTESLESANHGLQIRTTLNSDKNKSKSTASYAYFTSFIHWNFGDSKIAIQKAYEALRSIEDIYKSQNDSKKLSNYYMLTGSLLKHYGLRSEGLHLIELSALCLNSLLPNEETRWMAAMSKLARVCNSNGLFDDALNVCGKVLTYVQRKQYFCSDKSTKRSIMDIANNYSKLMEPNLTKLSLLIPQPVNLSFPLFCIYEEVIHCYYNKKRITEAKIIQYWLMMCHHHQDYTRVRNTINSKLSRCADKSNLQKNVNNNFSKAYNLAIPNIAVILDLRSKYPRSPKSTTPMKISPTAS